VHGGRRMAAMRFFDRGDHDAEGGALRWQRDVARWSRANSDMRGARCCCDRRDGCTETTTVHYAENGEARSIRCRRYEGSEPDAFVAAENPTVAI
jgi:hypothetical protein